MFKLDRNWLVILSELFVDISAAWFTITFIEPQLVGKEIKDMFFPLTSRFIFGIVTLLLAKYLRDKSRNP